MTMMMMSAGYERNVKRQHVERMNGKCCLENCVKENCEKAFVDCVGIIFVAVDVFFFCMCVMKTTTIIKQHVVHQ